MNRSQSLSIDHLTTSDATPVETIEIAKALECSWISIIPALPVMPELGFPNIIDDTSQHQEIRRACEDNGVRVHTMEGFLFTPEATVESFRSLFEMTSSVGASSGVAVILDADRPRVLDRFVQACEVAAEYGIRLNIEFTPVTCCGSMEDAVDFIAQSGSPKNAGIVVDTLHLIRSGGTAETISAVDPALIGAAQISDGLLNATPEYYQQTETMFERLLPGEGEFPLADICANLPPEVVIGVEVPMTAERLAGESAASRARRAVSAARRVLGQI